MSKRKTAAPHARPIVVSPVTFLLPPRRLSIPHAAQYIAVTNWRMEELVREGVVPFQTEGKSYVIDVQDLDRYVDQQKKSVAA